MIINGECWLKVWKIELRVNELFFLLRFAFYSIHFINCFVFDIENEKEWKEKQQQQ